MRSSFVNKYLTRAVPALVALIVATSPAWAEGSVAAGKRLS